MADHVAAARRALGRERDRVVAERDAFRAFLARLDRIPADGSAGAAPAGDHGALRSPSTGGTRGARGTAAVRSAYEATVMAVPHYEADYGDTFAESVAAEFREELAVALRTATAVTPALKSGVAAAARESLRERERFLRGLDREAEALADAAAAVTGIEEDLAAVRSRPFHECAAVELERLAADAEHLAGQCDALVAERQAALRDQDRLLVLPADVPHLAAYLYDGLRVTYPVLSTAASLARDVRTTRERIDTALSVATA